MRYRTIRRVVVALLGMTMLIACSSADPSDDDKVLTIAIVDNGDMLRIRDLADHFAAEHPDIELKWVVLREGELRQRVTTDIATGGDGYCSGRSRRGPGPRLFSSSPGLSMQATALKSACLPPHAAAISAGLMLAPKRLA